MYWFEVKRVNLTNHNLKFHNCNHTNLGALFPWRITIGITAIAPLITFLALLACPESPVWLLTQGMKNESLLFHDH